MRSLVVCSGSHKDCPKGCPHRKLHYPHAARHCDWDGVDVCTKLQKCGAIRTSRENLKVACTGVRPLCREGIGK